MVSEIKYWDLKNELKRGKLRNAYFLMGDNEQVKKEIIEKILQLCVNPRFKSFDKEIIYGDEAPDNIYPRLTIPPMGSKKRCVIVKEVQKLPTSGKKGLLKWLNNPKSVIVLVLTAPRQNKKKNESFYKSIEKGCLTMRCWEFFPSDVFKWISEYTRERRVRIDSQAMNLLFALVGNDLSMLASEIEKLISFVGERKTIMAQDVKKTMGIAKAISSYDLMDAIGEMNREKAIKNLETLLEWGEKTNIILATVGRYLKTLLKIKMNEGATFLALSKETKIPKLFLKKYIAHSKRRTEQKLLSDLSLVYESDFSLKMGILDKRSIIENLIYQLTR